MYQCFWTFLETKNLNEKIKLIGFAKRILALTAENLVKYTEMNNINCNHIKGLGKYIRKEFEMFEGKNLIRNLIE